MAVGAILGVLALAWLNLNLFQTLFYLAPLGLMALLSGKSTLRHLSSLATVDSRKKKE